MANSGTYQPVQSISIKASEDLAPFRFIYHDGSHCADGEKSVGATEVNWTSGEYAQVVTLGTITIETGGTVSIGDDVSAAADGKGRTALPGDTVNGRALSSTIGAGFVKIILVQ